MELNQLHQSQDTPKPSAFLVFVTGINPATLLTNRSKNNMLLIAVYSIFISAFYAAVTAWYLQLRIDLIVAAIAIGVAVFIFLLLLNKAFFLYFEKNKYLSITIFLIQYLLLCIIIIPQPFIFNFYSAVIEHGSNISAWASLSEKLATLTAYEKKSLRNFEYTIATIAFLFALLLTAIYILFVKQQQKDFDMRHEAFLIDTQQLLLQKEIEYSQLLSKKKKENADDPFALEESENISAKADQLMAEILHLKFSLQSFQ